MSRKIFLTGILLTIFSSFYAQNSFAQPDLDVLLRAGVEDANTLMDAYIDPVAKGVSASLVNGWYNTAKTHKPGRFDITITANAVYIPDDELMFNVNDLTLNNVRLITPEDGIVPTVVGPDDVSSTYEYYDDDGLFQGTFNGPDGFDLKENFGMQAIPVPMVQAGVGLFKNTDLKIRFTPRLKFEGVEFQILGGALMHDIGQYIFGNSENRPFDLSAMVGYTHIRMEYDMTTTGTDEIDTDNGVSELDITGLTFQGIISKRFSVLTLYAGAGYNISTSDFAVKGDYDIKDDTGFVEETVTDPIDLSYRLNSPRLTAGFRLKLAVVTLHVDYTLQKYNTLSAGFGFDVNW